MTATRCSDRKCYPILNRKHRATRELRTLNEFSVVVTSVRPGRPVRGAGLVWAKHYFGFTQPGDKLAAQPPLKHFEGQGRVSSLTLERAASFSQFRSGPLPSLADFRVCVDKCRIACPQKCPRSEIFLFEVRML